MSVTKFLLIRHGQSFANLNRIFAGHHNAELTEIGHHQAKTTAEWIATQYHVDRVYASDLQRAFLTGQHIADRLGLVLTPCPEFREIFAGDWEGVSFSDLAKVDAAAHYLWCNDIGNVRCPNGESTQELGARAYASLCRLAKEHEGETVVIVTHGALIRSLQCIEQGGDFNTMKDIPWVSNASVNVVEVEDGRLTFTVISEDSHLESFKTTLPVDI